MNPIAISSEQTTALHTLHKEFGNKAIITGCTTVAAAFLLIGALIVITGDCLCLMLPGVNVINDVILPAVVPGLCAIIISIPLIILAIKQSRNKNNLREQMITHMIHLMDAYDVPKMKRKQRVHFILHNCLLWPIRSQAAHKKITLDKNTHWTKDYQKKILDDITDKIGKDKKDRNPRQEKIARALEKAQIKLQPQRNKDHFVVGGNSKNFTLN